MCTCECTLYIHYALVNSYVIIIYVKLCMPVICFPHIIGSFVPKQFANLVAVQCPGFEKTICHGRVPSLPTSWSRDRSLDTSPSSWTETGDSQRKTVWPERMDIYLDLTSLLRCNHTPCLHCTHWMLFKWSRQECKRFNSKHWHEKYFDIIWSRNYVIKL